MLFLPQAFRKRQQEGSQFILGSRVLFVLTVVVSRHTSLAKTNSDKPNSITVQFTWIQVYFGQFVLPFLPMKKSNCVKVELWNLLTHTQIQTCFEKKSNYAKVEFCEVESSENDLYHWLVPKPQEVVQKCYALPSHRTNGVCREPPPPPYFCAEGAAYLHLVFASQRESIPNMLMLVPSAPSK